MTVDEKRRQKMLARKRKSHAARKPVPQQPRNAQPLPPAPLLPIHAALATKNLFAKGIGMLALARKLPDGQVAMATFVVDVYCLGVKRARSGILSADEWAAFAQRLDLEAIDPGCLRKLIEGAVAYARDLGFAPHADYARAAALFGNIDAATCAQRYTYGKDDKPLYVSGPEDTPAQSRHILETLTRRLGAKGFHFLTAGNPQHAGLSGEVTGPLTVCSYEITDQPIPDAAFDRLPAEVQERINALYPKVLKSRPREALAEVRVLIEQYPDIAQLYNYLYAACHNMGEHAEAARVREETVQRFPDYLFGRIAWAEDCLSRGETARIAEIFEHKLDLRLLYPDRVRFHLSEVLGFQSILARYFHAQGKQELAQKSYDLMCEIDPKHPSTRLVRSTLHPSRLGRWLREKLLRP
jgi:tetratricopeptide (TPR) repeat protein